MRERRWWVADDCYNMCINASVKRASRSVADGHLGVLFKKVIMGLLVVTMMIRESTSGQILGVSHRW
jgi:hypothetical protein